MCHRQFLDMKYTAPGSANARPPLSFPSTIAKNCCKFLYNNFFNVSGDLQHIFSTTKKYQKNWLVKCYFMIPCTLDCVNYQFKNSLEHRCYWHRWHRNNKQKPSIFWYYAHFNFVISIYSINNKYFHLRPQIEMCTIFTSIQIVIYLAQVMFVEKERKKSLNIKILFCQRSFTFILKLIACATGG